MSKKKIQNRSGFMMIEAVFSIFIVGVILVTFMAVMASSYRTEFAKRDLIVASNLAQEGIEIVRNIRDNNWKATPAKKAFEAPFPVDGPHGFDYEDNTVYSSSSCSVLRGHTGGFYNCPAGGGAPTKFSRTVTITTNGSAKDIISVVTWNGGSQSLTMKDTLYPWGDAN